MIREHQAGRPSAVDPDPAGGPELSKAELHGLFDALAMAQDRLLAARGPAGHWRGSLSASALSTATACVALTEVHRQLRLDGRSLPESLLALARGGRSWLARHCNDDGGWGDTVRSRSNLSTTVLCWAALECEPAGEHREAIRNARSWILEHTGSLEPAVLKRAVEESYGEDRTFSIPILTHCALAGVLGPREDAFRGVSRLPFELAAFPQSWFRLVGLPVVSYALPALIAVGQVQHRYNPSKLWPVRALRQRLRDVTGRRLLASQPASGGFLEAIPLTAFVTMSLAGAGQPDHPVVRAALRFLEQSVAPDGSWRIEVDLATWVTTLSILALSAGGESPVGLPESLAHPLDTEDRDVLRSWILEQQHRGRHPYNGAEPGGWAWTDLPGGVPDADDTAGALLALRALDGEKGEKDPATAAAAEAGLRWLLALENRDGGIPTFCRGWGKLPFDQSAPDLTAHTLRAFTAWREDVHPSLGRRLDRARQRLLAYLRKARNPDGSWSPLWFGNESVPGFENRTFGTARTLRALRDAGLSHRDHLCAQARDWLLSNQGSNGGWGGGGSPPSLEETALAVDALGDTRSDGPGSTDERARRSALRGAFFLSRGIREGGLERPAPIGFYFSNLWYFEDLYPTVFTVSALRRLLPTLAPKFS